MKEEKRILNVLGQVDEKYIDEAAPGKRMNKKPAWFKWGTIAACFALVLAIGIPMMNNQNNRLILSDASTNVIVKYVDKVQAQAQGAGALAEFTEEELFTNFNTAVFKGTVTKIKNIEIDYNGFTDYQAIAEIHVDVLYRGNCAVGDTVSVLLPCPLQANIWVEDTGVASKICEGTVGIFMPEQYDETSVVKMNGATLALQDISEYGLPDGERFAFLETDSGLVFDLWAYQSIAEATTLDEIADYVQKMIAKYPYAGTPVRGGATIPAEEDPYFVATKMTFEAKILEVQENALLVEPLDGTEERELATTILIPTNDLGELKTIEYVAIAQVGDVVQIGYLKEDTNISKGIIAVYEIVPITELAGTPD